MLISKKHKLIFISNPKTGTRSVQNFVLNSLDEVYQNENGNILDPAYNIRNIHEHSRASEIKDVINNYDDYKVFIFIRSPYDRAVSTYFFYRNGELKQTNTSARRYISQLNRYIVNLMPFKIWALVFPLRTNYQYCLDSEGKFIVNHVGTVDNLTKDLDVMLKSMGYNIDISELEWKNKSSHGTINEYFNSGLFKKLFEIKLKKDLKFYNYIKNKSASEDLRGAQFDFD